MPDASPHPVSDRGVIYVACGDRYRQEAQDSLASLRASNPGLPVLLLTDEPPATPALWDEVRVDPALQGQRNRAKLGMDLAPWERCLFLDTDTYVVGDLGPGFALLDRFEFAGQQPGGGHHYTLPGLPPSFPEVNSGVLFWRRGERTRALFARWRELFDAYAREDDARTWDQKSLRMALWESDLRIACLPPQFNLMPYFPAALDNGLIVAHGRNLVNLQRLHERLSASSGWRAYVPGLGPLRHPQEMSWKETLRIIARLVGWKLRRRLGRS